MKAKRPRGRGWTEPAKGRPAAKLDRRVSDAALKKMRAERDAEGWGSS